MKESRDWGRSIFLASHLGYEVVPVWLGCYELNTPERSTTSATGGNEKIEEPVER